MTHPRSSRFFSRGERGPPAGPLQALLHPPFGAGAGEVGQLGADVGAVGGVEDVHELAQGELRRAEQRVGGEPPIEVRLREPVHLRVHVRGAGAAVDLVHVERVDVRDAETAVAVGADEAVDGPATVVRRWSRAGRERGPGPGTRSFPFEIGEERTPSGVAAVGIRPVAAVGVFEKRGVRDEERGFAHGGPFAVGGRKPRGSLPDRIRGWLPKGERAVRIWMEFRAIPGGPDRGRAGTPARAGCRAERCPPRQGT